MYERKLQPRVVGLFICSDAGQPMQAVKEVEAIAGKGLKGDRYATGQGSFSFKLKTFLQKCFWWWFGVKRQVTLISATAFEGTGFRFDESRRNIVVADVELMWLVGREFEVGTARFKGVKYCDPCNRPSKLCGKKSFKDAFFDKGGLIAEVVEGGIILDDDFVILPLKNY